MSKLLCSVSLLAFIIVFSACSSGSASAQPMIGGRIGINIGNESLDPDPTAGTGVSAGSHVGILVGPQFDYWFSHNWAFSTGLIFDQKGIGFSEQGVSDNYVLGYLEIPLLVKQAFATGMVRPYIFLGPSIGFLLSATYNPPSGQGASQDVKASYNGADFSLVGGAGLSIDINGPKIFFDAAYALGLVNIDNNQQTGDNVNIKSRDIRIAAGVMFPLTGE